LFHSLTTQACLLSVAKQHTHHHLSGPYHPGRLPPPLRPPPLRWCRPPRGRLRTGMMANASTPRAPSPRQTSLCLWVGGALWGVERFMLFRVGPAPSVVLLTAVVGRPTPQGRDLMRRCVAGRTDHAQRCLNTHNQGLVPWLAPKFLGTGCTFRSPPTHGRPTATQQQPERAGAGGLERSS
jgi:hypothetical protein